MGLNVLQNKKYCPALGGKAARGFGAGAKDCSGIDLYLQK